MSHQDADGRKVRFNADYSRQALPWLLGKAGWATIRFREDGTWVPLHLAAAAPGATAGLPSSATLEPDTAGQASSGTRRRSSHHGPQGIRK